VGGAGERIADPRCIRIESAEEFIYGRGENCGGTRELYANYTPEYFLIVVEGMGVVSKGASWTNMKTFPTSGCCGSGKGSKLAGGDRERRAGRTCAGESGRGAEAMWRTRRIPSAGEGRGVTAAVHRAGEVSHEAGRRWPSALINHGRLEEGRGWIWWLLAGFMRIAEGDFPEGVGGQGG